MEIRLENLYICMWILGLKGLTRKFAQSYSITSICRGPVRVFQQETWP